MVKKYDVLTIINIIGYVIDKFDRRFCDVYNSLQYNTAILLFLFFLQPL
jgi:hypothetical protein